jgi:hypothetical protein
MAAEDQELCEVLREVPVEKSDSFSEASETMEDLRETGRQRDTGFNLVSNHVLLQLYTRLK